MMWGYGYTEPGMIAWMIISSVIWLTLVGVAVWALVRWLNARSQAPMAPPVPPTGSAGPSAHELLRQRYARGEIDEQTFARMRAQLDAPSTHEPSEEMLTGSGSSR